MFVLFADISMIAKKAILNIVFPLEHLLKNSLIIGNAPYVEPIRAYLRNWSDIETFMHPYVNVG